MSNRRSRSRRNDKKIMGINNTTFFIICIILIIIIIASILIIKLLNQQGINKASEESEKINEQMQEIFKSSNDEIGNVDEYKTNSIIRISAVGNILCEKNLEQFGKKYDNIFDDTKKYLKDADLTLGTYKTDTKGNKAEFAKSIKNSGIDLVSLANDKTIDSGKDVLEQTNNYLKSIELDTVGIHKGTPEERVKILEKRKYKIAVLAYSTDSENDDINCFSKEIAKEDLQYARENAKIVVVMMQWGKENSIKVTEEQEEQASYLVENGADIVIGSYPSCVQRMEIKKNSEGKDCIVAYSLGNYTSDSKLEYDNSNVELILNVQVFIDKEGNASIYKVDYVPIYMMDNGKELIKNRYKILDLKKEIENYNTDQSTINSETYEKLNEGLSNLKSIITE